MFREQYSALNKQISPSEDLLKATIHKTEGYERKTKGKICSFRKPVIALVSVFLCIFLVMPALAATVEPIYQLMYRVSPAVAQFFIPVQKSHEDNGIRMEVVSAYLHDNIAEIYITMQDLTGDRVDKTIDLYDSYSINRPFDSSAYCKRVGYAESTKTATFLITIEEWGEKDISGDKITFSVREFLSHKKIYKGIEVPIELSTVGAAIETQAVQSSGGGGEGYDRLQDAFLALVPSSPMDAFPVDGIDLTGIGYIDGKLHIQTAVTDRLNNDNHGFFYLQDSKGNRVDCNYNFYFSNEQEQPGDISYCDYVFAVPQNELVHYTLRGDFVTAGMKTEGHWQVVFPLELQP